MVYPTIHERDGARVDYYRMVTGRTRTDSVEDPRSPGETMRVVHVTELSEVCTCRECWQTPETRAALDRLWRDGT